MRLINTTTLQLEEFIGSNVPPYAILSHTWGPHEVSLQDYKTCLASWKSPLQRKAGYKKIIKACKECVNQKMEYCWVDTCCIDKSSSAELTEAINSMFRWYAESQVCLVHLEDLAFDPEQVPYIDISGCRWLTRGWCLQELIAPKKLLFFDSTWTFAADKKQVIRQLTRLTAVDEDVLRGNRLLSEVAIGSRLSWAASRQTTRIEDQAYCLLGILDINMPLLYGEGSKAFQRLQHEILQVHDDPSIFAWKSSSAEPYQEMLAPTIECFKDFKHVGPSSSWQTTDQMFSYTSKGIRVTSPKLEVSQFINKENLRSYVLRLGDFAHSRDGPTSETYEIQLLKIKPRMYTRLSESAGFDRYKSYEMNERGSQEDIYIIPTKDVPSIGQIASGFTGARIELGRKLLLINRGWKHIEPRHAWDFANSRFFIAGTPRYSPVGYVKLRTHTRSLDYFVLFLWLGEDRSSVEYYLISPSLWEKKESAFLNGQILDLHFARGGETTSIVRVQQTVAARPNPTEMKIGSVTVTAGRTDENKVTLSVSEEQ